MATLYSAFNRRMTGLSLHQFDSLNLVQYNWSIFKFKNRQGRITIQALKLGLLPALRSLKGEGGSCVTGITNEIFNCCRPIDILPVQRFLD